MNILAPSLEPQRLVQALDGLLVDSDAGLLFW